jgi:hypothetical protein
MHLVSNADERTFPEHRHPEERPPADRFAGKPGADLMNQFGLSFRFFNYRILETNPSPETAVKKFNCHI